MSGNPYARSYPINKDAIISKFHQRRVKKRERTVRFTECLASKTELLNTERRGFIQFDPNDPEDRPFGITQTDILEDANLLIRSKRFDLNLDRFGPYTPRYTRNGRHLLLVGNLGHAAAFDWQTKHLLFEMNTDEEIRDATWLHDYSFFACAQKRWTYVYDRQGVEIHCLKRFDRTTHLDFLPYHFLLTAINSRGYLSFLDVSTGQLISCIRTSRFGVAHALKHNPTSGISVLAHSNGSITMWTPTCSEFVAEMHCHTSSVIDVCFDKTGNLLYTAGIDAKLKIFDVRTMNLLKTHRIRTPANGICVSQTGLVGIAMSENIEIFKYLDQKDEIAEARYMLHSIPNAGRIKTEFCPFEDVLAIGHRNGLSSIVVPGSGEANFDAFECNPYQTKEQRAFWEVRALLDKIQPDMITLEPDKLANVDVEAAYDELEKKHQALINKQPTLTLRKRTRHKRKISSRLVANRQARERAIRDAVRKYKEAAKKVKGPIPFNSKMAKANRAKEKKLKKQKLLSGEGYNMFERFKK
ncbi:hypothetical protein ACOME3_006903 [Neoechinorhynchus agilis]